MDEQELDQLIDRLLFTGEGNTVDYKAKPYRFAGATDEQKASLLKDILAFSNAWRSEDAYILIGVSDDRQVLGITEFSDDAPFQQFINEKTNRPVVFSYREVPFRGVILGLFQIAVQERPIFIKKDFGKVPADTVFVRRGSSVGRANPDEVAKMGKEAVATKGLSGPELRAFFQVDGSDALDDGITFSYTLYPDADQLPLPDYGGWSMPSGLFGGVNLSYWRDMARYIQQNEGTIKFRLCVNNSGSVATDVRAVLRFCAEVDVKLPYNLLPRPALGSKEMVGLHVVALPGPVFQRRGEQIDVTFKLGKIQPGTTVYAESICLVCPPEELTAIECIVFADELVKPSHVSMPVQIAQKRAYKLDTDDIENYDKWALAKLESI